MDWFNAVDAAYRSELKDAVNQTYVKFEAKLDQRMAELKAELIKWMFLFWAGSVLANKFIP